MPIQLHQNDSIVYRFRLLNSNEDILLTLDQAREIDKLYKKLRDWKVDAREIGKEIVGELKKRNTENISKIKKQRKRKLHHDRNQKFNESRVIRVVHWGILLSFGVALLFRFKGHFTEYW